MKSSLPPLTEWSLPVGPPPKPRRFDVDRFLDAVLQDDPVPKVMIGGILVRKGTLYWAILRELVDAAVHWAHSADGDAEPAEERLENAVRAAEGILP